MKKILLYIKSLVILLISFSFFFTLNNGIKLKADESIENKVTISSSTNEITQGNSATANVYIETLKDIKKGEGKIIEYEGEKIGVYKDEKGKIFKVKPICTHLGCELYFNNYDKIWECPCHGSKFTYEGIAIEVPGIKHLEIDS